jgi:hypothetical protein
VKTEVHNKATFPYSMGSCGNGGKRRRIIRQKNAIQHDMIKDSMM